jgi:alpha-galactosidase
MLLACCSTGLFSGDVSAMTQDKTGHASGASPSAEGMGPLSGRWVGPFDMLDNGESNRIILEVHQNGTELKGGFQTLGYGMSLYGTIQEGKFDLYRPDRKPVFIQGRVSGSNLEFIVYGKQVIAHPETELDGDGPPPYIALPKLHRVPDNGLAKAPPMGWNSWNQFKSGIDDATVRATADAMVSSGMRDAGYRYVNIDDTWEGTRDAQGVLQPNHKFPDMKALAEYVHALGLKLGIYSSPGPRTCAGYPGSYGHEDVDARTWAAWGIDYLKYDWCSAGQIYKPEDMRAVYQRMGDALLASGRPIVFSVSQYGEADVQTWGTAVGANLWRTSADIRDDWASMTGNAQHEGDWGAFANPGHWNDPDMLEIGNGHMSDDEYRTHMSLWILLAAPLLAGNDLRSMSERTVDLLTNREVIAVDQDKLGRPATCVGRNGELQTWTRPLSNGDLAVGVFNMGSTSHMAVVHATNLKLAGKLRAHDLWKHTNVVFDKGVTSNTIPPHGVWLLRVSKTE